MKRKAETAERVETKVEEILGDISPEAMAKGIVDNLRAVFVGLIPRLPEGERFTVDSATGYFTSIPFAMLNGVVAPRFASETVDHAIEAFIEHARAREVPMLWQLTPDSRPDNLRERLEAHGFHGSSPGPGMAVELGTLPTEEP